MDQKTINTMEKSKEDLADILEKISSEKSPVGIDAQYTHMLILDFLRQIDGRLDRIEKSLEK
ncbi:MAG: hypothetical protein JKX97_08575 [Candidatus Lindowbacteria bacterium]|nr:hypothetical protein [Candidatus Lindowbacteria bacterium]